MALVIKGAAVPNSAMATYCGSPLGAVVFNGVRVWPDITGTPLTITNLADEAITWKWTATGSPSAFTFRRSSDGGATWGAAEEATSGKEYELAAGASVSLYAEASALAAGYDDYWSLSASGAHSVSGDATSLLGFDAELRPNALRRLFYADAELTDASSLSLPSATLAKECYRGMFGECTGLVSGPALPAATLAEGCYRGMFWKCKSLASAPELPATTLAEYCYYYMFGYCTGLTSAPELPATEMEAYCYEGMFDYCKALASAPALLAATLATNCYRRMFEGCSVLDHVECMATDISAAYCTELWLSEVADTGTFVKAAGMEDWEVDSASGIPLGWTAKEELAPFTITNLTSEAITWMWTKSGSPDSFTFVYSTDGGKTWSESVTASSGTTYEIPANGSVQIKTDATTLGKWISSHWSLSASGSHSVSGDIMTLVGGTSGLQNHAFAYLFEDDTPLADASSLELPATTLANYCYRYMFNGCTSLTSAPELPATTLASYCYEYMFYGCSSLAAAPELPATTLASYCYQYMFYGCSSLAAAPELPATTLASDCYEYMFYGCSSLAAAPELPATTLASYCYHSMFKGCTSLTSAPELPATTLASSCYSYMFNGCTGLTSAPELPATTLASYCYHSMFNGCTSLTSAPELPATTLASSCYGFMFNGCTGLTSAPELPATTLASYCYMAMFQHCKSLTYVKCLATDMDAISCTKAWLNNVSSSGTFVKAAGVSWDTGSSGIPDGWTVEEYSG